MLLELPIQLDIYLNYQPDADAIRASYVGFNFSLTTIVLIVLYGLWLAEPAIQPGRVQRLSFRPALPLFTYVVFVTLSVFAARDAMLASFEIWFVWQSFLLYFYVINRVRSRDDVLFVITMLLIGLVFQGLVMIGLRVIGHSVTIGHVKARVDGTRVGGTVGSPNVAAMYLTLLLAPALSMLLTRSGRSNRLLAALGFGLGTLALLLTLSRGGWIATAVSMALLGMVGWHRGWLSLRVPALVALAALPVGALYSGTMVERMTDDGGSAGSRVPLMKIAFDIISDQPMTGVGANNYVLHTAEHTTLETASSYKSAVHNKYLLIWAETGIGALLAFLWFLLATIRRGWRTWLRGDAVLSPLALAFTVAIMGQMIHMGVARFSGRPPVQMLWLVAAIITATYLVSGREGQGAVENYRG